MLARTIMYLLITGFASLAAHAAPDIGQATVDGPVGERLHRYLQWAEQFGFSGAVLVALDGRIVLHQGYGFADREGKVENTIDTVFSFGSIAKQFTGAGIMKLVEGGTLHTSDPITTFFKNVPPDKKDITVHQLLTHSSGVLNSITGNDFLDIGRDEAVAKTLEAPLQSKPGEAFHYSNAGMSLAAAVIEIVSGQDYVSFMTENIFLPAGMVKTGFMGQKKWPEGQAAHIYQGNRDNGSPVDFPGPYWVLLGNGGVVSSVGEMYLWDRALRNRTVLNESSTNTIFTAHLTDYPYGYGWDVVHTKNGSRLYRHDGGSSLGLSAQFFRYPDENGAFIMASNATIGTGLAIEFLTDPISGLMFEDFQELPEAPALETFDRSRLKLYAGKFGMGKGSEIVVRLAREDLFYYLSGQPILEATGIVDKTDTDRFRERNLFAKKIVEEIFAGDSTALMRAFGERDDLEAATARWPETILSWARNRGAYRTVDTLGTRRVREDGANEPVTWMNVNFERGKRLFRFHWTADALTGLGGQAWPTPMYGPIRFIDARSAIGFHFDSGQRVELDFDMGRDGKAKSISLHGKGYAFKGRKKNK